MGTLEQVKLIDLPKFHDPRGNISVVEGDKHIPFDIGRTYWVYDVPGGEVRGAHAFRDVQEFIIALSGSFDVVLDDGNERRVYSLNRSYFGLYIPKMVWRTIENFSTNSLCLIMASKPFDKKSYIRDYASFVETSKEGI